MAESQKISMVLRNLTVLLLRLRAVISITDPFSSWILKQLISSTKKKYSCSLPNGMHDLFSAHLKLHTGQMRSRPRQIKKKKKRKKPILPFLVAAFTGRFRCNRGTTDRSEIATSPWPSEKKIDAVLHCGNHSIPHSPQWCTLWSDVNIQRGRCGGGGESYNLL